MSWKIEFPAGCYCYYTLYVCVSVFLMQGIYELLKVREPIQPSLCYVKTAEVVKSTPTITIFCT